jgi:hypothetical protein
MMQWSYDSSTTGSNYYEMDVQPDTPIPLHIRGGYVLPLQEPANNTHFSRKRFFINT